MNRYLYVILFDSGLIKVGQTANLEKRIRQHISRVSITGVKIVSHNAYLCFGNARSAEFSLIRRCEEISSNKISLEWFLGLDYDKASSFAEEEAEFNHLAPPKSVKTTKRIYQYGGIKKEIIDTFGDGTEAKTAKTLGLSQQRINAWPNFMSRLQINGVIAALIRKGMEVPKWLR